MSLVTYNGISLPYPFTTEYRQETVQDESGTDQMMNRFDITVQTIVNPSYLATFVPGLTGTFSGSNPASIMNFIRELLLTKRKRLSFKTNGVEQIPFNSRIPGTVDSKNGPEPIYCNITQLTDSTFIMQYRIVAHYWEARKYVTTDSATGALPETTRPNPILSNRWTETIDIDDCIMTTRTRDGKFTIASDNVAGLTADRCRRAAANLGVPPGFLRTSSRYNISTDGLSVTYQIVDREQFKMPPAPAYKASGYYREGAPERMSNLRTLECGCKLRGSKTTSQNDLLSVVSWVVASKIYMNAGLIGATLTPVVPGTSPLGGGFGGFGGGIGFGIGQLIGGLFGGGGGSGGGGTAALVEPSQNLAEIARKALVRMSFVVNVNMYENEVEAQCTAVANASSRRFRPAGIQALFGPGDTNISRKCFTPGSDGVTLSPDQPNFLQFGTAGLFLQAAAYYDPSLSATTVDRTTRQFTNGREVGTAGIDP